MTAFFAKIGQWFVNAIVTQIVKWLVEFLPAWNKRRQDSAKEKEQEAQTKPIYDQAVQNGTSDEIIRATENRFRG